MKNQLYIFILAFCASLSSCQVVGEIYQFGVWSGIMAVLLFVALVFWLLNKAKSKGKGGQQP